MNIEYQNNEMQFLNDDNNKKINYLGKTELYELKELVEVLLKDFDDLCEHLKKSEESQDLKEKHKMCLLKTAELLAKKNYQYIIDAAIEKIKMVDNTEIYFEESNTIDELVMVKYAPVFRKTYHRILYKQKDHYTDYMKMHGLMLLHMMVLAHKAGNLKFTFATAENTEAFNRRNDGFMMRVTSRWTSEEILDNLYKRFLNLINTPIYLLAEDKIYNEYRPLRPLQFATLMQQELENIKYINESIKNKSYLKPAIKSFCMVTCLVSSLHLKDLYGVDLTHKYNPTKLEMDRAKDIYDEYKMYKGNKHGKEYDLVKYLADSQNMESYYTMADEEDIIRELVEDNYEENEKLELNIIKDGRNLKEKENDKQLDESDELTEENAGMMTNFCRKTLTKCMVEALITFESWPVKDIFDTACEIDDLYRGKEINITLKSGYNVTSLPGMDMSGYQLIAYYYVSWAIAAPCMLPKLGLEAYREAYRIANLYNQERKANSPQ